MRDVNGMRFIVVDGLDGSGKSTQARIIYNKYLNKGEKVILREHPSDDNLFGIKAKKSLLKRGTLARISASLFYALDVMHSVHKYKGSECLIMVRYLMGLAYIPSPLARLLYQIFTLFLPTSQYMFFLDVDPEKALERMENREEKEMFENLPDLIKARNRALNLAKGWHVIKNNGSIEESCQKINQILDQLDGT